MRRDEWDEVDRSDHTDVRLDWRDVAWIAASTFLGLVATWIIAYL